MPIRLSGLASGMDTEALVSAMMSSYNLKKDNLVKAQTKLSWKQDSWQSMNTSIYSFYTGALNSAKQSKTYNVKNCTISNSIYAKVSAATNAVNGTQSLVIEKLAATGYLTGGQLKSTGDALTEKSKLSALVGPQDSVDTPALKVDGGTLSVTVDGKSKDIALSADMTIADLVSGLNGAGLNASFDEKNQRIFVSSKTSGKDHDFTLTASDAKGLDSLRTLGLYTDDDTTKAEYKKWAEYTPDQIAALKTEAYEKVKVSYEDRAKQYADKYNTAAAVIKGLTEGGETRTGMDSQLSVYQDKLSHDFDNDTYIKLDPDTGLRMTNDDGTYIYNTDAIAAAGKTDEFNLALRNVNNMKSIIKSYDDAQAVMDHTRSYVGFDGDKAVAATAADSVAYGKITDEITAENAALETKCNDYIDNKVTIAQQMNSGAGPARSEGSSRIDGQDARIKLNGATFNNNTNNFTINGLTIQAQVETGDAAVSITTETDVDGVYNSIKSFISDYNKLIKSMDSAYNATSSKGYEPLTSAEKSAMTDDEVKEWEKKIKDSLLRKDATLGNTASSLKSDMLKSYVIDGKSYSLSSFGIKTLGYFTSGDNEKGVLHIDGDPDDTNTKGNDDKLKEMIANDPETVVSFFSQLSTDMYTDLTKRMGTTSLSSIYVIYNDKQMKTEYSDYKTKISDQESKIKTWEDYYYNKFAKMESALAKLNSNSSSLSGLLGK